MLLIVGTIRVPPETIAATRAAARRMIEATRAEDGCAHYAFAEDVLDPGLIQIYELWRDQAALDAHFASAHMAEWRAVLGEIGVLDRKLRIHEVGEGRPL
ncbi:putative quinol monooxygenase [Roseiarcus fermentans]|nr:putative quinol monooxygenase [Roseiarcus fermentans]